MNSVVSLSTALALKTPGPRARTTTMIADATVASRDAVVQRSIAAVFIAAAPAARERRIAGAQIPEEETREQHGEERDMARDQKALRADERAEALRDSERDPAGERAPERSGAADDRGFEGEDQLRCAGVRIESRAHAEKGAGDRDGRHAQSPRRPRSLAAR